MKVNVQYAEAHLTDLMDAAFRGEVVEIESPNKSALRLVLSATAETPVPKGPRILGAARGLFTMPSDEEWRAADKELERLMNDGPVFPDQVR